MRLYLDDDCASLQLLRTLRSAGHDVESPRDAGTVGKPDAVHLIHCITNRRIVISRDHGDFELLHVLVRASGGQHPGILVIREDNSRRDMTPPQIARAIGKLVAAAAPTTNEYIILNQWR